MSDSFDFNNIGQRLEGSDNANMPSPPSPNQHDAGPSSKHGSGNVTVYQTTGPDAYNSPILSPGGSGEPVLNPRSCVTCRRRKVRCDKQMPCSNCRRAQIPCVFPAPGRAPRQPRPKDPNAPSKTSSQREVELIKRLKKLEGIVEELSGQIDVDPSAQAPSNSASPDMMSVPQRQLTGGLDYASGQSTSPRGSDSAGSEGRRVTGAQQSFGRLVLDDSKGTSRYVSSRFWSKLNDELDSIREETQRLTDDDYDDSDYEATPDDSPSTGLGSIGDHHGFVFGYRSADVDLKKCHPLPSHATFLWSVYQENVEPLIKLVHIPTVDLMLREVRRDASKLTPANEALVFSIYLAAITSLEPDEVQTNFGTNKDDLFAQYRFAVEQALARANFLDTSEVVVLQAFTIFLIVVRRHDESRFCWALTGLLSRIAQGMGLHRDGENLGLTPFNTEIRRRVWWAILVLDLRSAEELGTDLNISEGSFDTKTPLNINEADISPDSTESPAAREGRSDSAVAIVRCEICSLSRRLVSAAQAMSTICPKASIEASIAERESLLIDVYQRVEDKFLKHVLDETDPLYWVAAMIARVIVAKMCLVIYQPMMFPGCGVEVTEDIRQRVYVAAIEVIEYGHKLNTDPRCKQYRWLFKTYTNWHAIAYTLIETCRRPWTPLVERGWIAVTGYDIDPLQLAKKADHAAVFLPLRRLFAKARRHREAELLRLKANPEEARKLDFAERMNPAQARFGPVPGAENTMEQTRERWWAMIRPEGASPMPFSLTDPGKGSGASQAGAGGENNNINGGIPLQIDMDKATMDYMDEFMSQPNPMVAELWKANSVREAIASDAAMSQPPMIDASMAGQDNSMGPQASNLSGQPIKDDHLPPYLWPDAFPVVNSTFGTEFPDDTDMLGDDFNWQDWSQSIRGLEMESTQSKMGF